MNPRLMRATWCIVVLMGTLLSGRIAAQTPDYGTVYRPPGTAYSVLETPHFAILFEEGLEQEARETAAAMEAALPETARLVGVRRPFYVPVVLNRFNDRANGYVRPFPFKQEIESVAIRGSTLTPRFPSWLEQVSTHELAHAVHAEFDGGFGVGRVMRWFAPDLARLLNFTAPSGITEGLAVFRESQIYPRAGRLNVALVNMEFRAAMLSESPWSLSQVLEPPFYTRPFNRYYNGGAHFIAYLAERDSLRSFRRASDLYYRAPFLGYGAALWYGTGTLPHRSGRAFREHVRRLESARMDSLGPFTEPEVIAGQRGEVNHRPRWLNDSTLVVYSRGYDLTPGFYRVDVRTGARTLIARQALTEDDFYSLSPDSSAVLFSRYVPDPFVLIREIAEAFRMDLATGETKRLTDGGRVFAPVPGPDDSIWAVQNAGQFTRWVRIREAGVEHVLETGRTDINSIVPSPDGRTVALLVNAGGYQGLFRVGQGGDAACLEPWLVFEDAVIYDADWSRDGRYLFFTADRGGVPNIYAYDRVQDRILKLTNVPFGALEPGLSPDGTTLAFINYRHEQYDLVTMPFEPDQAEEIPRSSAAAGRDVDWQAVFHEAPVTGFEAAEIRPYSPWRYLRPRMFYPLLELYEYPDEPGTYETKVGLGVQGVDPLQRVAYKGEVYYQREQVWGEAAVEYGQFLLRPALGVYSRPLRTSGGTVYQDRGVSLGLRAPVLLHSNVSTTYTDAVLRVRYRDLDLIEESGVMLDHPGERLTLSPTALFAYGLQRNVRDLIPNSGFMTHMDADMDVWTREAGAGTRALATRAFVYLPFLRSINHGIRLDAGILTKNQAAIYDPGSFVPRGFEDRELAGHTFARYGLEYVAPLRFVDDGLVLLPVYIGAVYAYAFAERLHPLGTARLVDAGSSSETEISHATSVGGGAGLQARLFFNLNLDIRVGMSYRVEESDWQFVGR